MLVDMYGKLLRALFLLWLFVSYMGYMIVGITGIKLTDEQCEQTALMLATASAFAMIGAPIYAFLPYPHLSVIATSTMGILRWMYLRRRS